MGKPGAGKSTLGKLLESNIADSRHYSFGELLKQIQTVPKPEGYTLDDRQRVYDFLKEQTSVVEILIIDGNPYPPTNFNRRKQLDGLFGKNINISLECSDEIALSRLKNRGREMLVHEGKEESDRIEYFKDVVLPEIEKAKNMYRINVINVDHISPDEVVGCVMQLLQK